MLLFKVEKILKGSLDSILSPSPSVKIQIMGGKICFSCKAETLLGVLPLCLKQFEFSIQVKVMGLNQVYLLKSFLLYLSKRKKSAHTKLSINSKCWLEGNFTMADPAGFGMAGSAKQNRTCESRSCCNRRIILLQLQD